MSITHLLLTREPGYATVQFNRPEVLNALNRAMIADLIETLEQLDADDSVRAIILTGGEKAFAAGADITEMAGAGSVEMYLRDQFAQWDRLRRIKKPLIAAVAGVALGGGCEIAMTCDLILAAETARFGQPEINLGVIPGAGGTQRLTRAVGKYKAMEMVLTGAMITAREAFQWGLVNRVVPAEILAGEAAVLAKTIASKPPLAVRLAKEAVLKAFDTTMEGGLEFERKNFYLLFASEDQKEGMKAFTEKRKAEWKGR
ncbi:MAG TPA: enoyl-CoA hydratase-related protein [Bacteroidota bacterium]|nr:enoyl-CoA hydratase-related protein [Bacteroidota bacterium]